MGLDIVMATSFRGRLLNGLISIRHRAELVEIELASLAMTR